MIDDQIVSWCNCVESENGNKSGRTRARKAIQTSIHVFLFKFVDKSCCKDAFSFQRHDKTSEYVFTPEYYFFVSYTQNEVLEPECKLLMNNEYEFRWTNIFSKLMEPQWVDTLMEEIRFKPLQNHDKNVKIFSSLDARIQFSEPKINQNSGDEWLSNDSND